MGFESYYCFDVEMRVAFSIIFMNVTKKTSRNTMDRVGLTSVSVLKIRPTFNAHIKTHFMTCKYVNDGFDGKVP
jgi:hypothetical protein